VILCTAALALGKALLVPLALATLFAFLLAPVSSWLERRGLGRAPSVIAVCLGIGLLLGGIGWLAAREVASLSSEAPRYRENLRGKIDALRGPIGSIDRAAEAVSELEAELAPGGPVGAPSQVEVVERSPFLDRLGGIVAPIADLLESVAVVAVLSLFMLWQREDLRDRVIRLIGGRDLTLTTSALDDAATRISRYLGTQALLCGAHGVMVGTGLWLIGIPGALLWGVASGLLRFVPYFGPWLAAILPIATAAGALDGWTPALATLALFVVLELVSNNLLEPWLYGSSVGLSPFAIILSAVYWSWLWGVPGLLLATPLSACLVVLGHHVRGLEFIATLLSDEPALQPGTRLYQRLLAGDVDEAEDIVRGAARSEPESALDHAVLPALRRFALDVEAGAFDEAQAEELRASFDQVFVEIHGAGAENSLDDAVVRVVLMPALDPADELAGRWLAAELAVRGVRSLVLSRAALVSEQVEQAIAAQAEQVWISALTPAAQARAQKLVKRLQATGKAPDLLVGAWAATMPGAGGATPPLYGSAARWVSRASELFASFAREGKAV
jgi:predicted PurR-regulated permease PerM